ncbi:DUF551 domain-containing protein [Enterobacter asburiae]|uniref:DUF551 domain-containing protein n=1 Tax=Enterobacter asburiae TaxID=61645 RepID=A0ABC9U9A3_ENTAS|nr:DUF551 domain-containing protein [Enterobacter asburiae]ESM31168.1 hypothetical protein L402_03470 [Enterobacter asburiae]MDE7597462.1 DUF551 domain-containing protein [Enterobacter asburiae]
MSTITKEWLQQKIAGMEATRDEIPFGLGEDGTNTLAALRIALASLEAEPVGEVSEQRDGLVMDGTVDLGGASTHRIIKGASKMKRLPLGTKFYTAPPAPVSVPDAMEMDDDFDSAFEHGKAVGWNACRAAMLQGAEPVTTACKLPANTPCKDAPEHIWLQTAGIWPASRTEMGDVLLYRAASPAAVSVPDGVLKSLLPDAEKPEFWFEHNGKIFFEGVKFNNAVFEACRAAILQRAEPVQGWIPCSDRMPTKNHRVLIFINFNSDTVPPSIHDAQFTGSTFRRGNATVNVFPLEDGYGVTHWMPLPAAPQQEA